MPLGLVLARDGNLPRLREMVEHGNFNAKTETDHNSDRTFKGTVSADIR